jgi:rhodanese-related sulfurtransferase
MMRIYQLAFTAAIISMTAIGASSGFGETPASSPNRDSGRPAAPLTASQRSEAANAVVPRITPAQAKEMINKGNTLVLDVREVPEVEMSGKIAGAVNVPNGTLEVRADPKSPSYDKNFTRDKILIIYCVSGRRAALAGKTLKDMGYANVYDLGGFSDWVNSGGAVEPGR